MTTREEIEAAAEIAFQRGNTDRLIWTVMEIVLDIRELLLRSNPAINITSNDPLPPVDTDTGKK